jgi:HAD superfamily, subfamily IIIB (Acid phosphatase)
VTGTPTSRRPRRPVRTAALAALAAAAVVILALPGSAVGLIRDAVAPPPANPTSADQIQNIDQVKTAIKGYYGDMIDPTRVNPIDGKPIHTFSPTGAYANEVGGIVDGAENYLQRPPAIRGSLNLNRKSVVFDVDDTTLNTYSYEIYTNFVYNPTSNAAFVNAEVFPAVPHMVDLEHFAESRGYTIFFLTGRPGTQRAATVGNLQNEGYDVNNSNVYLKDYATDTWLSPCAPSCSTTQYKSLTRAHIESLGYDIVGNFGDQYSDLNGGFADQTFKMPNPMYYLP